jgi:hypothetical protein
VGLCTALRMVGECRTLGRWECLLGVCIAGRMARGYMTPRTECPGGIVYSREDSWNIYEARDVGVPRRGCVELGG